MSFIEVNMNTKEIKLIDLKIKFTERPLWEQYIYWHEFVNALNFIKCLSASGISFRVWVRFVWACKSATTRMNENILYRNKCQIVLLLFHSKTHTKKYFGKSKIVYLNDKWKFRLCFMTFSDFFFFIFTDSFHFSISDKLFFLFSTCLRFHIYFDWRINVHSLCQTQYNFSFLFFFTVSFLVSLQLFVLLVFLFRLFFPDFHFFAISP